MEKHNANEFVPELIRFPREIYQNLTEIATEEKVLLA